MAEIKIYKNGAWENIIGQDFNGNEFKEGDKIYADGKWHKAEKPDTWYIPLTFTAKKAGSTVKLTIGEGSPTVSGLQYRLGTSGDWNQYIIDTEIILTNIDDKVQFQNTNDRLNIASVDFVSTTQYVQFVMTGTIAASGNIQSMLNYNNTCNKECFRYMFYHCSSLITAPELPAKKLADNCYGHLFAYCTNLINPPELPATELVNDCYNQMFNGCRRINSIKVKFTNWQDGDDAGTNYWAVNINSTGTFYKPSALPEEYGESRIPEGWTVVNID